MKLRYKIGFVLTTLAGVFLWGRCSRPVPHTVPKPAAVLPKNDKEQILFNPLKHTITVVTTTGVKTETLPDKTSTVDIENNGQIKVTAPQFGFETRPFVGIGFGSGARLYAGADFGYIKKFDIGLGLASPRLFHQSTNLADIRAGLFGSYNFWSNSRVTIGIDNQKTVHFLLSVRL